MCHVSCVMCLVSHVMCHLSGVRCHLSYVNFKKKSFIKKRDKVVELVGGGSVIKGAYPVFIDYSI